MHSTMVFGLHLLFGPAPRPCGCKGVIWPWCCRRQSRIPPKSTAIHHQTRSPKHRRSTFRQCCWTFMLNPWQRPSRLGLIFTQKPVQESWVMPMRMSMSSRPNRMRPTCPTLQASISTACPHFLGHPPCWSYRQTISMPSSPHPPCRFRKNWQRLRHHWQYKHPKMMKIRSR